MAEKAKLKWHLNRVGLYAGRLKYHAMNLQPETDSLRVNKHLVNKLDSIKAYSTKAEKDLKALNRHLGFAHDLACYIKDPESVPKFFIETIPGKPANK